LKTPLGNECLVVRRKKSNVEEEEEEEKSGTLHAQREGVTVMCIMMGIIWGSLVPTTNASIAGTPLY
jgi:hypothetical protein